MNAISLNQIEVFLSDFKQKQIEQTEALKNDFKRLLSEYEQFRSKYYKEVRFKAPSFNIFRLLGVTRDEVRTHSRFLAELLHPAGGIAPPP